MTVTVALDAMGGDHAPKEIVQGAVEAVRAMEDVKVILLGPTDRVTEALGECGWPVDRSGATDPAADSSSSEQEAGVQVRWDAIEVCEAPDVIAMGESPVESLKRKPRSSILMGIRKVAEGAAQAFVSAGNTGACVAAGYGQFGLLKGVRRPGIAVQFRCEQPVVLIDVGANIKCTPEVLLQYGIMASAYAEEVLKRNRPRIGLLNVGSEEAKGGLVAQGAFSLFQQSELNFVGNIEGDDIFKGVCDVVVCDGFVGNVVLKISEGLAEGVYQIFRQVLEESASSNSGTSHEQILERSRAALQGFRDRIDYAAQGGAPLLGVDGICIICHGRSHSQAIANAIRTARDMARCGLNQLILERLKPVSIPCDEER